MADSRKRIPSIRAVPESLDNPEEVLDYLRDVHRLMRQVREGTLGGSPVVAAPGGTPTPGPPGDPGPPGPPAPGTTPDPTPPPTPTGLSATAGFANIFVQWDVATYTQGRGNLQTNVYGAKYSGTGPLPTFSNAVLVGVAPQPDTIFILPTELSTQWHIWIKFQTRDGVESVSPAGGANGASATTGKIGNADLGPLIVEAGNLASGAVTASKLAAGAVEFTKFAAGLEPVGVVGSLPNPLGYTGPRTVVLTTDGKLYRLVSGAWTAAVPAADITGQLTDAQLASIAAAKLTGQITSTQITDGAISTPKLAAGAVTAAQIAADTITAAQIAANAITATELAAGSVTTAKLLAGAVTANEIAANAVTTAKIAAGAVNATQIAARAIKAEHLLIAPKSLWPDPDVASGALSWAGFARRLPRTDPAVPAGCPMQFAVETTPGPATRDTYGIGTVIPCVEGETYRVSFWWNRGSSIGAGVYPEVVWWNNAGTTITGQLIGARVDGSGWIRVTGVVTVPPSLGYVGITPAVYLDGNNGYTGTGWFTDVTLEKVNDASLIVDGAIVASKLAANAIAVGSAAIQNGAIVNAMIADATIDSAKIATLSAGKITAGSLGVGSFIQSNDYVSGVAGWRISGNGFAELGSASIRGLLQASQLSAWSISAGRAIIADGTINDAKIETLTATKITSGNLQGGGYIRSAVYSPGSAGWTINADGTAEFGAAAVRGKLSAGNIIGASSAGGVALANLSVISGQVSNQQAVQSSSDFTFDQTSAGSSNVNVIFSGELRVVTTVSFAGGGGTYKLEYEVRLDMEAFNGSTWVAVATGLSRRAKQFAILTGNEEITNPITLAAQYVGINLSGYTKLRGVAHFVYVRFRNLTVNGGTVKTDAMNQASVEGEFFWQQTPN